MNLEKVFNFIKEKKGYNVPTLYKLLNDIPLPDDEKTEYINKLDSFGIYNLLSGSKEPDKIINILKPYQILFPIYYISLNYVIMYI